MQQQPAPTQNHVAQGRLENAFDECDPEATGRVKRPVLRDALLASGFTEIFVDVRAALRSLRFVPCVFAYFYN